MAQQDALHIRQRGQQGQGGAAAGRCPGRCAAHSARRRLAGPRAGPVGRAAGPAGCPSAAGPGSLRGCPGGLRRPRRARRPGLPGAPAAGPPHQAPACVRTRLVRSAARGAQSVPRLGDSMFACLHGHSSIPRASGSEEAGGMPGKNKGSEGCRRTCRARRAARLRRRAAARARARAACRGPSRAARPPSERGGSSHHARPPCQGRQHCPPTPAHPVARQASQAPARAPPPGSALTHLAE